MHVRWRKSSEKFEPSTWSASGRGDSRRPATVNSFSTVKCLGLRWAYSIRYAAVDGQRFNKIDADEHKELLAFFADFAKTTGHRSISLKADDLATVRGICAVDPHIQFQERLFCFTGKSERATRVDISDLVVGRGGKFKDNVVLETDYLIVGADGNPCWAYACYGRKIEQAIKHRKNGHQMLLVHEHDFWDFV